MHTGSDISSEPSGRMASVYAPLSEFEVTTIELFVSTAHLFGFPRSIGEIYGLLFVSPDPLPFEAIRERLMMSSGSASQGLRLLRNLGAVQVTYVAGERSDHYVVEIGVRRIAAGFVREKLAPSVSGQEERLTRLLRLLEEKPVPNRDLIKGRLQVLENCGRQIRALLPILMDGWKTEEDAGLGRR
jgi:DNA-binding transcriptional regulator GbsR (MarR family)